LYEGLRGKHVLFVMRFVMKLLATSIGFQTTVSYSLAGLLEKRVRLFGLLSVKDRVK
jgi:hypothetical protein